jgi:hypothetical protein
MFRYREQIASQSVGHARMMRSCIRVIWEGMDG